jgi:hypothetical protein
MMNMIDLIKKCFISDKVLYSKHALQEMEKEELGEIFDKEIEESILSGEIIEKYEDDKPYPSYLILGYTKNKRPIHIVVAYNKIDDIIIIVTVYQPDPNKWINDRIRRN